jgi:predicted transposase/invertase (TIGR01784 family)
MAKYLNPKVDLTFKKVFGEHPNLVKSLLNALLPLPEGMTIETVEYLTGESIPDNPAKKLSIVDVRCKDNYGRGFIVEMQNLWNSQFFQRTLFNATSMYSKQLEEGNPFDELKDVYSLALVNSEAFDYKDDEGYMQEFYITNKKHPDDKRHDLVLIFVELQKFKPSDRGSRAIKDLWLKYLTEIDEKTQEADAELLENPEISQALKIVEKSAYSDADLYVYNDYLLEIMSQHHSMKTKWEDGLLEGEKRGRAEGRAEGLAEGLAEGAKQQAVSIARKMLAKGLSIDEVSEMTGLTPDEISKI